MALPSTPPGPARTAGHPPSTRAMPSEGLLQAYLLARETLRRVKPTATPCFAIDAEERRREQRARRVIDTESARVPLRRLAPRDRTGGDGVRGE